MIEIFYGQLTQSSIHRMMFSLKPDDFIESDTDTDIDCSLWEQTLLQAFYSLLELLFTYLTVYYWRTGIQAWCLTLELIRRRVI